MRVSLYNEDHIDSYKGLAKVGDSGQWSEVIIKYHINGDNILGEF